MGTQTMGESKSAAGDGLARQGSLYNLTLDEVQNQLGDLGKPLSSMNLDELLKSVWTAEANQDYAIHHQASTSSSSSIHRQSSLTLTRDLSKKTVDEVWRDIQQGHKSYNDRKVVSKERQATLGEMTLEDFLVKAGIVAESNKNSTTDPIPNPIPIPIAFPQQSIPQTQWANYQIPPQQQNMLSVFMPGQQSLPIGASANPIMDTAAYPDTQMAMSPSPLMGTLSDTQTPGRKRVATGGGGCGAVVEKTVERRQKRMIKNRESAARSRARKQAYTNELENKVSRLEEENERLKRQKEMEKVLPSVAPPEPKYQLRRTSSSSF